MKEAISLYCRELKLGQGFVENIYKTEAATHEEFLLKLLENEMIKRKAMRKTKCIKSAKFDLIKTFEGYEFREVQIPRSISREEIVNAEFIERKENLLLYGQVGTGKTHLATAIGVAACNQLKSVRFYRTAALVNELIEAKKNGNLNKFLKQLCTLDLLICDEWGYIPLDREGAQLLFQVIADCYEKRSVIITTNLEFGKWNTVFYDERLTSAIIDRLIHHSHILMFAGASYRLKNTCMKQ